MTRKFKGVGLYLMILVIALMVVVIVNDSVKKSNGYTIGKLTQDLEASKIVSAEISPNAEQPTGEVVVVLADNSVKSLYVTDVSKTEELIRNYGLDVTVNDVTRQSWITTTLLPCMITFIVVFLLFTLMSNQAAGGGGGNKVMNFGKSRAKMSTDDNKKVTFKEVAGLDEEKEELKEIVDFLKNPKKYVQVGARIPKGVLLVGPPGTGKTLIAKAVAGEAGVPFFSISGSDFVEMFVGVGASRVRDLFEEAKKNAPCIIFIDEIDAVARRRGTGMGGGHDEREQTLNQLLVEMDGFGVNEGIIVMSATNRVDILDPAILRPGRFDRKVGVGRPDIKGREEILKVHAKNKPLGDNVDLSKIAQTTAGFTGADLENLLNEAAIYAAREERTYIMQEDIDRSFVKVGIGAEKKSRVITEKEKKITAYHEAGHALATRLLTPENYISKVTIIPSVSGAGGFNLTIPKDTLFQSQRQIKATIQTLLAGRIAEELIFGTEEVTTGASNDIQKASSLILDYINKFGMDSELGLFSLSCLEYESDNILIDKCRSFMNSLFEETKQLLQDNLNLLEKISLELIEKESLSGNDIERICA